MFVHYWLIGCILSDDVTNSICNIQLVSCLMQENFLLTATILCRLKPSTPINIVSFSIGLKFRVWTIRKKYQSITTVKIFVVPLEPSMFHCHNLRACHVIQKSFWSQWGWNSVKVPDWQHLWVMIFLRNALYINGKSYPSESLTKWYHHWDLQDFKSHYRVKFKSMRSNGFQSEQHSWFNTRRIWYQQGYAV